MAFLVFKRAISSGKVVLSPTGDGFKLAGYNLIYSAWEKRGYPINQGWHVSADELIQIHTDCKHSYSTRRLIIDFDPNAKKRIGLVELLDLYAYTWGNEAEDDASWTPIMLRMRDVFYEEYDLQVTKAQKAKILNSLPEPTNDSDFVEFLYLNGPKYSWNWGKNGMTNAVFLRDDARDYFRKFF